MFGLEAFRTWGHVLVGASVIAGLFLGVMLMVEAVAGSGPRLSRAAVAIPAAAFLGYLATAWIIRLDGPIGD